MARRNPMKIPCPQCGGIDVRLSHWKNIWEKTLDLFGIPTMRCLRCHHRWRRSLWRLREMIYARCPRCFRLELTTWDETYYRIPALWRMKIAMGGKQVRCKACRHNFVSFRLVKHMRQAEPVEDETVDAGSVSSRSAGQ